MVSNRKFAITGKVFLARMLRGSLALVRGPLFLSFVSLSLLLIIPAAQATLLKGFVSADGQAGGAPPPGQTQPQASVADNQSAVPVMPADCAQAATGESPAQVMPESPAEAAMHRRAANLQSALAANSFPASFEGAWRCVTTVVGSGVTTVSVGQTMQSEVHFLPQSDGRVVAQWRQPGWTEGHEQISALSDHEAALTRVNYYVNDSDGQWSACSHDHYLQVATDRMVANSRVEQFDAGQYLGSYTTRSVLYRLN
jgi:hypothetical protein